jgi:hypothetical protein
MHNRVNRDRRDLRHDRAGDGEPEYFARSLSEAAYIYLQQVNLLRIDGRPGAARFWFLDKDQVARNAAAEYRNGGRVEAVAYSQACSQLKKEAAIVLGKNPARGLSGDSGNPRGTLVGQEQPGDTAFAEQFAAAMQECQ